MGWRFRKSIKLPFGFRINFSTKGMGWSWGVPGYRKTHTATGKIRTTYSIPHTGISYVEEEHASSYHPLPLESSSQSIVTEPPHCQETVPVQDISATKPKKSWHHPLLFSCSLCCCLFIGYRLGKGDAPTERILSPNDLSSHGSIDTSIGKSTSTTNNQLQETSSSVTYSNPNEFHRYNPSDAQKKQLEQANKAIDEGNYEKAQQEMEAIINSLRRK